jgi:hypothetical protein
MPKLNRGELSERLIRLFAMTIKEQGYEPPFTIAAIGDNGPGLIMYDLLSAEPSEDKRTTWRGQKKGSIPRSDLSFLMHLANLDQA